MRHIHSRSYAYRMPVSSNRLPNPVLVSRQIEGLREVLRRMRAAQPQKLDPVILKKIEKYLEG